MINEFKNMGDFITEDILRVCVSTQNKFKKYGGDHPAVFPENIVTPFILQTSDVGDLILDPFMGSGTTLDVGLQLGRRVVGYEINSYYCDLVKQKHEYSLVS